MTPDRPASLARRALPAVALGGASMLFVLALDRPADETDLLAATDDLSSVDGPVIGEAPAAPTTTPSTTDPSTTSPSTTSPSVPSRRETPSTSTPSTTSPSTTVPATPTCTGDTVTGPSVSTRFGPVQVAATIADDGTICAVDTVSYPRSDRRSAAISQRAIPTLESQAVSAQSARINGVSGATYTSRAFAQSLQAVVDG